MKYLKIILCLFLFLGVIGLFSVLLRDNSNDSIFSKETFSHDQSDCESESFIFEETADSVDSNIESNTDFLEETTDIFESNIEVDTDLSEETFDDQVFSSSKYLVFGDSIAAGSGLESRKHSYPNRAGALLNLEHVSNNAVGGSTLALDPNNEKRRCIANDVVEFASKSSVSSNSQSIKIRDGISFLLA